MALEFSLRSVVFYDFFYEANCESLSISVEKMCYIQLQRPQKVKNHVFKPTSNFVTQIFIAANSQWESWVFISLIGQILKKLF